jgi:hypothetical protein
MMNPDTEPEEAGAELPAIRGALDTLGRSLAAWAARREPAEPDAAARHAASAAIDALDAALAALHRTRARLITEIRIADAATDARADALLARLAADADANPRSPE